MSFLRKYNEGRMGIGGFDEATELGRQHRRHGIDPFNSPGSNLIGGIMMLGLAVVFIAPIAALAALYLLWKMDWRAGVLYIATMTAEFAFLDSIWRAKRVGEMIDAIGAYWELSWLPKLLPNTVWWEGMLFVGAMIGLAVAVALPMVHGWRSFLCGLLCLPIGLCAGLAASPLVWSTTWTLGPLLFPLTAVAVFMTVAVAAQRARGSGLLATMVWGCAAAGAFGYYAYTLTPDELVVEFHGRFYKEELDTIVAWTATTNLWAGSAIGFGSALIGGLPLVALFGRKPITMVEI